MDCRDEVLSFLRKAQPSRVRIQHEKSSSSSSKIKPPILVASANRFKPIPLNPEQFKIIGDCGKNG